MQMIVCLDKQQGEDLVGPLVLDESLLSLALVMNLVAAADEETGILTMMGKLMMAKGMLFFICVKWR